MSREVGEGAAAAPRPGRPVAALAAELWRRLYGIRGGSAWSWSNRHCPLLLYSSMQLRVRACPGRPCPQSQVCAPSRARATNDEEADLSLGVAGGERAWPHAGVRQARLGRRAITSRSTAGRERAWPLANVRMALPGQVAITSRDAAGSERAWPLSNVHKARPGRGAITPQGAVGSDRARCILGGVHTNVYGGQPG
jgi:hypothetical protein